MVGCPCVKLENGSCTALSGIEAKTGKYSGQLAFSGSLVKSYLRNLVNIYGLSTHETNLDTSSFEPGYGEDIVGCLVNVVKYLCAVNLHGHRPSSISTSKISHVTVDRNIL